jgi:hypothetical protein
MIKLPDNKSKRVCRTASGFGRRKDAKSVVGDVTSRHAHYMSSLIGAWLFPQPVTIDRRLTIVQREQTRLDLIDTRLASDVERC